MPRPKKPGAPEPKRRSRNGCWNCKAKKIKCGEEKPICQNCSRSNEDCDYSIRLNWDRTARSKRPSSEDGPSSAPQSSSSTQTTFVVNGPGLGSPGQPQSAGAIMDQTVNFGQMSAPRTEFSNPGLHMVGGISSPSLSGTGSPAATTQTFTGVMEAFPSVPNGFPLSFSQFVRRLSDGSTSSANISEGPPPAKRTRFSPSLDPLTPRFNNIDYGSPSSNGGQAPPAPTSNPYSQPVRSPDAANPTFSTPNYSTGTTLPPTPAASASSDDVFAVPFLPKRQSMPYAEDDPRRMSVNSLLNAEEQAARQNSGLRRTHSEQKVNYGIDRGLPDYDVPNNIDAAALNVASPTSPGSQKSFPGIDDDDLNEFGFGLHGMNLLKNEDKIGVDVAIPRSLLPLPSRLRENPMNLLYFNHFVNHVARILVPHDCSQNPFRIILPQMAVRDDNLLCLLLAYSASHRARLLGYKEPSTRIALWVENVFPNLRHALDDPETKISNTTIATAIMLASREIIAPNTFGTALTWQTHLDLARRIIAERGGPEAPRSDRVSYFLMRWFAYLDIISTLMSGREAARYRRPSEVVTAANSTKHASSQGSNYGTDPQSSIDSITNDPTAPTLSLYTPEYFAPDESDFRIDCLLGFTTKLVSLLARVAHLARRCDASPFRYDHTGNHNASWRPDAATQRLALKLKADIEAAKRAQFSGCPDADISNELDVEVAKEKAHDTAELAMANQAFHCAALIHLNRRVLAVPRENAEVQGPVKEILRTLGRLRKGGTAETGFLFPMFTAGVEVLEQGDKALVLERVKGVEGSGMVQVTKARRLMEMAWDTGRPWETLVQGEFFG